MFFVVLALKFQNIARRPTTHFCETWIWHKIMSWDETGRESRPGTCKTGDIYGTV